MVVKQIIGIGNMWSLILQQKCAKRGCYLHGCHGNPKLIVYLIDGGANLVLWCEAGGRIFSLRKKWGNT
jgi:hypothetical protein